MTHVYNPLAYAWEPHEEYLCRVGAGTKEVVLVGMNPGRRQSGLPGSIGHVTIVYVHHAASKRGTSPNAKNTLLPPPSRARTWSAVPA